MDVETVGFVGATGSLAVATAQFIPGLPATISNVGNWWIAAAGVVVGAAVWWRKRKQRLERDEDRPTD